jgi:hypothetical protein
MRRTGIFKPVLECTQVTPTARVFVVTAFLIRSTISSSEIELISYGRPV